MNIGIVTAWLERGAAYVSNAYFETLSRKHNVFIYARGAEKYAKGDQKWDKEYVTWGKRIPWKINTYVDWKDFKKWKLKNNLDIIIFNEQHSWEIIIKTLMELEVIIGAYIDFYIPQTVPFFKFYDFLLCNTRRHYSVFKDHPQAFYIPWGTDTDMFKYRVKDVASNGVTFFHSCGMSPLRKGTDILVRAFQYVKGNAKLIIHSQGAFDEHPSTASIVAKDSRIELIRAEVSAPGLYYLGDVYVYPTRLEGIGLTIAEALASGLPVITTNAPPMNEFVVHDLNGKLVEVEKYQNGYYYWPESICSENALAEAMQFYVDNINNLKDYKYLARKYAEDNLDWRKNSYSLPDLLKSVSPNPERLDSDLMTAAEKYESSRYNYPYMPEFLRTFLHKAGAGQVKEFLERISLDKK